MRHIMILSLLLSSACGAPTSECLPAPTDSGAPSADAGPAPLDGGPTGPYCDGSTLVVPFTDAGIGRFACDGPAGCDAGACDQTRAMVDSPCLSEASTSCSNSAYDQGGGLPTNQLVCSDGYFLVDRECFIGCSGGRCIDGGA